MDYKIDYINMKLAFTDVDAFQKARKGGVGCADSFRGVKILFNNDNIVIKKGSKYNKLRDSIFRLIQKYLYDTYGIHSYKSEDESSESDNKYETFYVKFIIYIDNNNFVDNYHKMIRNEDFLKTMIDFLMDDIEQLWNDSDHDVWNFISIDITNNSSKFEKFIEDLGDELYKNLFIVTDYNNDNIKAIMWNNDFSKTKVVIFYKFIFDKFNKYEYHIINVDIEDSKHSEGIYVSYGKI